MKSPKAKKAWVSVSPSKVSNGKDILSTKGKSVVDLKGVLSDEVSEVARTGNIKEFERLYYGDDTRIFLKDAKGLTVLHHAASKGKIVIMDFILGHGGDIDAQDSKGNTPLHVAVENAQVESVHFLINNGAKTDILNQDKHAPIHDAIDIEGSEILEALLSYPEVDPNLPGELGSTALHCAAAKNDEEAIRTLLDHGGKMCAPDSVGFYPVHVAVKHASAKALEILLQEAEKNGYSRAQVLSFVDKEKNMALHSAVNAGNMKAVEVCLDAGALIDAQKHDGSTPVHLACAQGSLAMVKVMFEKQPKRKRTCITLRDINDMTPLHKAAMFDHVDIMEYLLDSGADIDVQDNDGRTPLLLAASKYCWRAADILLRRGSRLAQKDKHNRNFLHLAIANGARLEDFYRGRCDFIKCSKNLLNEKDDFGCTPLHYASKEGHLSSLFSLLQHGASVNLKNAEKQNALHFAARYGRFNTCRQLLESPEGPNIINEPDGTGFTPLLVAAFNGHTKVVQLLLQRGALTQACHLGFTPLHASAVNGYTITMRAILNLHPQLLNAASKDGNTALHIAAMKGKPAAVSLLLTMDAKLTTNNEDMTFFDYVIANRYKEVATSIVTHDRWIECLHLASVKFVCPGMGMIQNLPEVYKIVLDRCRKVSNHDPRSKDFYIHYDFQLLQIPMEVVKRLRENKEEFMPLIAMNTMVKHNRLSLLTHPVCMEYLRMKWQAYGGAIHWTNLILYLIFLVSLTVFVVTSDPMKHVDGGCDSNLYDASQNTSLNESLNASFTTASMIESSTSKIRQHKNCYRDGSLLFSVDHGAVSYIWVLLILIFCGLNMVKEVFQMVQQKLRYFLDWVNCLEWLLYVSSAVFVAPFLFDEYHHYQWEWGAVAIFLAWFNLLLFLQRFDVLGIYIVMFLEILQTLLRVFTVFGILIIAFSLAFFVLMSNESNQAFSNPQLSLFRTSIMMLGEMDSIASFITPLSDDSDDTQHFPELTVFFIAMFVLLIPILLMNLLIGLAVGDIETVQRNAALKRLAMQVELHTEFEKKLPQRLLMWVDKTEVDIYPNRCKETMVQNLVNRMASGGGVKGDDWYGEDDREGSIRTELDKQKRRLKEISSSMDKHYELLRLIVQKMEIRSEADDRDEGIETNTDPSYQVRRSMKWSSPVFRQKLATAARLQRLNSKSDKPEEKESEQKEDKQRKDK